MPQQSPVPERLRTASGGSGASGAGTTAKRNRKVYTHEMTPAEKAALQQCRLARNYLASIQDAIQDGKPVTPEIVDACSTICSAAGKMLFS